MESFYRLVLEVADTNLFIFCWRKFNHMPTANIEGGWKSCQVSSGNKTKQNKTKENMYFSKQPAIFPTIHLSGHEIAMHILFPDSLVGRS